MPELPEVETVRSGLEKKIINCKIEEVKVLREKTLSNISAVEFCERLKGQTFSEIKRKAKNLFLEMKSGLVIGVHLKMSGAFLIQPIKEEIPKHTHIIFVLDNNLELRFKDLRAFGRMNLFSSWQEAISTASIIKLAPEPISKNFSLDYFKQALQKYKSPIKPLLLEQSKIVSGIGNIYADESLFLSGIQPTRMANSINETEAEKLYKALKTVIINSIKVGGTSIRDYVDTDGQLGNYALQLNVYGRKKQNCLVCESPIQFIKLGQRGTHFCSNCQT